MELLIVQLLIVAFLLAYLMGEDAAKGPNIVIISHITDAPDEVWEAWEEKIYLDYETLSAFVSSQIWKEEIANGLNWSAKVGPTPA